MSSFPFRSQERRRQALALARSCVEAVVELVVCLLGGLQPPAAVAFVVLRVLPLVVLPGAVAWLALQGLGWLLLAG